MIQNVQRNRVETYIKIFCSEWGFRREIILCCGSGFEEYRKKRGNRNSNAIFVLNENVSIQQNVSYWNFSGISIKIGYLFKI